MTTLYNNKLNHNAINGNVLGGIYEKILRAKDGRLVRVRFVVSEMDGRFKGHIIAAEPVELIKSARSVSQAKPASQAEPLFLPAQPSSQSHVSNPVRAIPSTAHFSPYFSFEFFMSQPTRAPSRAPSFA
jgi:hypothetical protein